MAAKSLREIRRAAAAGIGSRRCFSGDAAAAAAAAAGVAEGKVGGGAGKEVNLFTAINQALHIALDTDPR
jgi:2-oxoisovalerate dehydrogenase E1 component beta subunit